MSSNVTALPAEFYGVSVEQVACELLGKRLVSTIAGQKVAGLIVETEAYLARGYSACHGTRGKTNSNAAMFGPAGCAYVYPIHSRYCLNAVVGQLDEPSAVLIRAIEPVSGVRMMQQRRGTDDLLNLASGPGKLCQAFAIDRTVDHQPLFIKRKLWVDDLDCIPVKPSQIKSTPRIGVTSAKSTLLRFVIKDNRFVSGPRKWR